MALYDMLEKKFHVSATVSGSAFSLSSAGFGFINLPFPRRYEWLFRHFAINRRRKKLFDYVVRFGEFLGVKDFISLDPDETVGNILAAKGSNPEIRSIFEKVAGADLVVVHGEGDLVFATPPRREALFLLGMAALGTHLGKKVAFVNALVSDCPTTGRNLSVLSAARTVLSKCSAVVLRDRESFDYVRREMPAVSPDLVPDSLFTWFPLIDRLRSEIPANGDLLLPFPGDRENHGKINFSKPYICIGGSAAAVANPQKAIEHYSQMVEKAKTLGFEIYLTENDGRDEFLRAVAARTRTAYIPVHTSIFAAGAILANARLFISGRYHATILASIGGTPCIFLGSSAHKMRSLQEVLEYDHIREFPVFASADEYEEIVSLSREYLRRGRELREKIRSVARKRCDEAMALPELVLDRVSPAR
jgi:polysaccharide pyruvyl transferase WcaK-like protein